MGAVVVVLVAAVIMLVLGVVVAGARLVAALRRLGAVVEATQQRVQPAVNELSEAGQVANLELADLQARVDDLGRRRRTDTAPGGI